MKQNPNQANTLKQIYKSSIKASYFAGFDKPEFAKKSRIQIQNLSKEQENIDDKTFRILPNFTRAQDFIVVKNSMKCYLEPDSLFSCFSKRRASDMTIINSKLSITNSDKIVRFVDFNVVWAKVSQQGQNIKIKFQQSQKQIYIQPVNDKSSQCKKWYKIINDMIGQTDAIRYKFTYLPQHNPLDFYKTQHVINSQFVRLANSGDIILFKSQHSAAAVQRVFTDSQYDHVGVVLRNKKNQLFIYQSTSDGGVGFTPWKHMIKYQWYKQTDKICWRQLNIKLTQDDINAIQSFVVKTLGKQFQINLEKLLQFKSKLQRTTQQQEKKTYFCSQLVARLYKQIGILSSEKSSTSYYPVDFTDKGALKIVRPNVSLSNERLISFDKLPHSNWF